MQFKTDKLKKDFEAAKAAKLRIVELAEWFEALSKKLYSKEPVVTDFIRTMADQVALYGKEQDSVHLHKRGIDFRSSMYSDAEIVKLAEETNKVWQYDAKQPSLKCCLYHKIAGGAYHFHFQVHPNTKKLS